MFPHKVGTVWEINAPAKINLYLEVLGPRDDGFHSLETLMVPVRIFDQLQWTSVAGESRSGPPSDVKLRIRNLLPRNDQTARPLSTGKDNLVLQAIEKLAHAAGVEPRGVFQLTKRIGLQAGLGGGSSNAAAALLLVNACWKINYSRHRLSGFAADLGSDVPFFLSTGAAVCRGRGEQVEPVAGLPRLPLVIVKPYVGLSTAAVYAGLQRETVSTARAPSSSSVRLTSLIETLRRGAIADAGRWMINRLESSAEQLSPWIGRLRNELAKCGCCGHLMTGSGSAYVGVMRSARQARRTARRIAGMNLGNVFATSSC